MNFGEIESFFSDYEAVESFFGTILIIFLIIMIISLIIYILSALGLMKLSKKNKVDNPWLAFIPFGNYYLLGKLGFEIYSSEKEKNPTLTWIIFALSIVSAILSSDLGILCSIVLMIFSTMSYNRIYKKMIPNKSTLYTVLSFFFGGIPLFFNKNIIKPANEILEKNDESK